jgi:hypothetical protein
VEEDQPEARVHHAEVDAEVVEALVEQLGEEGGGQVDGGGRRGAPEGLAGRAGGGPLGGGLVVPGTVGAAVGRGQPQQRRVVEGESLRLEVRRQGGEELGHVPVDVDDRVAEASADGGGGAHEI